MTYVSDKLCQPRPAPVTARQCVCPTETGTARGETAFPAFLTPTAFLNRARRWHPGALGDGCMIGAGQQRGRDWVCAAKSGWQGACCEKVTEACPMETMPAGSKRDPKPGPSAMEAAPLEQHSSEGEKVAVQQHLQPERGVGIWERNSPAVTKSLKEEEL